MAVRRCCSRAPAVLPSPPPLPAARATIAAAAASSVGALHAASRGGALPRRAAHNANAPLNVVPAGRVSPIPPLRTVLPGNLRSAARLTSAKLYASPLLPCCSRKFSGESIDAVLGCALAPAALPQGRRLYSSVAAADVETATASAAEGTSADLARLSRLRNIGISAHIDSGKTTLTERVLFYTGRISEIHDVKGRDGVGAKMDSMDLEREKGITIQSAATYCDWGDYSFNIIDTPGHVDFTIEVERALRVLDGAILVVCAVSGVQSQTITVDRQMKRYNVPRLTFVNKMDRVGADPFRIVEQVKDKLRLGAAAVQIPIGREDDFQGVVDLVAMKAYYNEGLQGEKVVTKDIPAEMMSLAQQKRKELIEALADVDEQIADQFLAEETPTSGEIMAAIRRATLSLQFTPVFMGSAFKNKSVQPLLDGVGLYLPNPNEVSNEALDFNQNETAVPLKPYSDHEFVGLAFKLEDGPFGQLSYMRIYQGKLSKGDTIYNAKDRKKVRVSRLVRVHANEMEEVSVLGAGEICALFGLDCASGDTFTSANIRYGMTSMFVPEPVVSLSVFPINKDTLKLGKALSRFSKEDPTFRVHMDPDSKETIISGMGELHLEIYIERMRREYGVPCTVGRPRVAYRETITAPQAFDYLHKRQSGGAGQFARVIGRLEPMEPSERGDVCKENSFENQLVGMAIPAEFISSVHKGMKEAVLAGPLIGQPVIGVRMVLEDGVTHVVDSSDLAFKIAAIAAFKEAFVKASPIILEPVMTVTVCSPNEFHGDVLGSVNRRKATILNTVPGVESFELTCRVTLNAMFGYSAELRSITQGKGEFTMEYWTHEPCMKNEEMSLIEAYAKEKEKGKK